MISVDPAVLTDEYQYVQVDPLEQFGVVLDDRYDDRIVVWKVIPRSPAFYAGIRPSDVITVFQGQPVTTRQNFVTTVSNLQPGEIPLQVTRRDRPRDVVVDMPEIQARSQVQSSLRPSADVERPNQLREERIEDRRDNRRANRSERAAERPVIAPAPPSAPAAPPVPVPGGVPVPRPGLFPRR